MSDLDVVSSSTDLVSSVYGPSSHSTVPDSSTGLVVTEDSITSLDPDSLSVSLGKHKNAIDTFFLLIPYCFISIKFCICSVLNILFIQINLVNMSMLSYSRHAIS